MSALQSWAKVGLCPLVMVVALSNVGCAQPGASEATGSVTSKQLAPDPLMKVGASDETRANYGISEWRFYRGRGSIFVTGYNSKGKPVKGVATMIARTDDGTISQLELNLNNGSKASVHHSLETTLNSVNAPMTPESQAFLRRATLDFARVGVAANLKLRKAGPDATAADVCASALPNSFAGLALCIANAGNDATANAKCQLAAELAEESRLNCHGLASPTGGVIDPLPPGLSSANLSSVCGNDPTCSANMGLLQQEESFGQGCGGDPTCETQGFGFDPFGTGGGSLPADNGSPTRPDIGGLVLGDPSQGTSCASSSCTTDIGNFRCTGDTCSDIQPGSDTGAITCISGDCDAFKNGGTPQDGTQQVGNMDCQGGTCSDIGKGAPDQPAQQPSQVGGMDCQGDTCSDIGKGGADQPTQQPSQVGGMDCQGDTCSDIGKGAVDQPQDSQPNLGASDDTGEVIDT